MAKATNNRTDEYGGSIENRAPLHTARSSAGVREALGPDFPIVVRWSPVDFIKSPAGEGLSIEEALQIAPMLEEAGADLHDLAVGWHETSEPLTTKVIEDCHWTWISQKIKTVAKKPVAQGYRNTDPTAMEQALQAGKVDVIAGLRYSIADPDLPRKVMEDRTCDMRKCIVCCRCLDDVVSQGKPMNYCGVNPHLGAELDHEDVPESRERKKRVMVVGSGPAGINAARVRRCSAAMRSIFTKQAPRLGGCVKMSSIFSPYHERYLRLPASTLVKSASRDHGASEDVRSTPAVVAAAKPDAVIVAVGGDALWRFDVPGVRRRERASTSHDLLEMLNGHTPHGQEGAFNNFMWWGAADCSCSMHYTPSVRPLQRCTDQSPWPVEPRASPSSAAACRAASSATCAWRRAPRHGHHRGDARRWASTWAAPIASV